jgi:V8-like Glu-specific endopeptidase
VGYFFVLATFAFTISSAHANVTRTKGGGYIVPEEQFPAVVQIFISEAKCSATLVGPNVILTAAHCALFENGFFYIGNRGYNFKFFTYKSLLPGDEDIAIGITDDNVENVKPFTINFKFPHGKKMLSLGYGCSSELSESFVTTYQESDNENRRILVSDNDSATFACHGDSGGPTLAYTMDTKLQIVGVHTNSDLKYYTYDRSTENPKFIHFIKAISDQQNLQICGYNLDCD